MSATAICPDGPTETPRARSNIPAEPDPSANAGRMSYCAPGRSQAASGVPCGPNTNAAVLLLPYDACAPGAGRTPRKKSAPACSLLLPYDACAPGAGAAAVAAAIAMAAMQAARVRISTVVDSGRSI